MTVKARPLSSARLAIMFTKSFTSELMSYSTGMISILPASIFEKSRMSFTSDSRLLPAF